MADYPESLIKSLLLKIKEYPRFSKEEIEKFCWMAVHEYKLTEILLTFCKFSLEMNLLKSTIKLLHKSLSNSFINNSSDPASLFFLNPKPKEMSVL